MKEKQNGFRVVCSLFTKLIGYALFVLAIFSMYVIYQENLALDNYNVADMAIGFMKGCTIYYWIGFVFIFIGRKIVSQKAPSRTFHYPYFFWMIILILLISWNQSWILGTISTICALFIMYSEVFVIRPKLNEKNKENQEPKESFLKKESGYDELFYFARRLDLLLPKINNATLKNDVIDIKNATMDIYKNRDLHASNAKSITKFSSYYVPTTIKLLEVYINLSKNKTSSANVEQTKKDVLMGISTMKEGFKKLYDNMFESVAMDTSVEVSTLKNILAMDGLSQVDELKDLSKSFK